MDRRRFVLHTAGAVVIGGANRVLASTSGQPPPPAPVDTGTTQGGKVDFPPIEAKSEGGGKPPAPDAPDQRVRYAVVGLGRLSVEQILPAFAHSKHARVTALVSGTPAKAETIARQYGVPQKSIYSYADFDRLRDNQEVDAVYIVLPNSMHHEYVLRAAAAGKHVLCEKPMATSVKDAEEMTAACERAQRKLMIAYRMQYEPYNREVIRMARAGELGNLKQIVAANYQKEENPEQWRLRKQMSGGGSLPDIGIYCLNAARYITGEEPVEIMATTYSTPGDPRFREVEEAVSWSMRFPSGCLASMSCSYAAHQTKRYSVHGTDAVAEMSPAFPYNGLRLKVSRRPSDQFDQSAELTRKEANQFALELDHLAACIRDNIKPHTPGEEGVQDHRVMEAIYDSARNGKPVHLPQQNGLDITRGPAPREES